MGRTQFNYLALIILFPFLCSEVQANAGVPQEGEEFCDYDEQDDAQSKDSPTEQSFCQKVLVYDNADLYSQDDYNILAALGTSNLKKTYPSRFSSQLAFNLYDEMPYPVPTGASTFFMVVFTMIFTWYFGKFLHWMLRDLAKKLNVGEETTQHEHFPSINLYMLQQSRKESQVNRDVRNTWAWVANFYLLKPDDPFVKAENVFKTDLTDQVPRDVWHIIREILKGNVLDKIDKNKTRPMNGSSSSMTKWETDEEEETVPVPKEPVASAPAPKEPVASAPAPKEPVASAPSPKGSVASSASKRPIPSVPAPNGPVASVPAPKEPVASSPPPSTHIPRTSVKKTDEIQVESVVTLFRMMKNTAEPIPHKAKHAPAEPKKADHEKLPKTKSKDSLIDYLTSVREKERRKSLGEEAKRQRGPEAKEK